MDQTILKDVAIKTWEAISLTPENKGKLQQLLKSASDNTIAYNTFLQEAKNIGIDEAQAKDLLTNVYPHLSDKSEESSSILDATKQTKESFFNKWWKRRRESIKKRREEEEEHHAISEYDKEQERKRIKQPRPFIKNIKQEDAPKNPSQEKKPAGQIKPSPTKEEIKQIIDKQTTPTPPSNIKTPKGFIKDLTPVKEEKAPIENPESIQAVYPLPPAPETPSYADEIPQAIYPSPPERHDEGLTRVTPDLVHRRSTTRSRISNFAERRINNTLRRGSNIVNRLPFMGEGGGGGGLFRFGGSLVRQTATRALVAVISTLSPWILIIIVLLIAIIILIFIILLMIIILLALFASHNNQSSTDGVSYAAIPCSDNISETAKVDDLKKFGQATYSIEFIPQGGSPGDQSKQMARVMKVVCRVYGHVKGKKGYNTFSKLLLGTDNPENTKPDASKNTINISLGGGTCGLNFASGGEYPKNKDVMDINIGSVDACQDQQLEFTLDRLLALQLLLRSSHPEIFSDFQSQVFSKKLLPTNKCNTTKNPQDCFADMVGAYMTFVPESTKSGGEPGGSLGGVIDGAAKKIVTSINSPEAGCAPAIGKANFKMVGTNDLACASRGKPTLKPETIDAIKNGIVNTYFQCVGFAQATGQEAGVPLNPAGNGVDYASGAQSKYHFVARGKAAIKPGDIPVWSYVAGESGSAGHIAVATEVKQGGRVFTVAEGNGDAKGSVNYFDYTSDFPGLLGWLVKN